MPKASNNGFAMFMLDYRKREERHGGRKFRGLDEVVPFAGAEWSKMSAEQKAVYKEKARDYKTSEEFRTQKREIRNRPAKPKASGSLCKAKAVNSSTDESFADDNDAFFFDNDESDKLFRRREADRNALKNSLSWKLGQHSDKSKAIVDEPFYIIAVQNYYETPEHDYQPAELAFVEFTLAKGITKQFTTVLKPIAISPAWSNRAMTLASETHQISPERPPTDARDDYRKVVNEIKRFYVDTQPSNPGISNEFRAFALTYQFNSVQGAVKTLRDKTGSKMFIPQEKISCVEDLYTLLCSFKGATVKREDLVGFGKVLNSTHFDFEPNTLCSYHSSCCSKFCALAIARKLCYHLFERMKDVYDLLLTVNHIPKLPEDVKFNLPKFSEKIVDDEDESYARLVAPSKPLPTARSSYRPSPVSSTLPPDVVILPPPAFRKADEKPALPAKLPGTLPASMSNLPGFKETNFNWEVQNENLFNEAIASAPSIATTRKRVKEPKMPSGLSNVKWEEAPVYSSEKNKFVSVSEVHQNGDHSAPRGFPPVVQRGFTDNTRDNIFDDEDDLEVVHFAATSSPFDNRRNSMSPVPSFTEADLRAATNRLNSFGLNRFSPPRQYNLNADGGAVSRSIRLPFCKPNSQYLKAPMTRGNNEF